MKIEQMLHGYDNGHRLLASSVLLKSNIEMDTIATLSDWSEYVGAAKGNSSYVTAYPLPESGYFVVARTWYAYEMKRPGCVWTHSLLLPFEEINAVDDFRRLEVFFSRPTIDGRWEEYSHSIDYHNRDVDPSSYKPLQASKQLVGSILHVLIYRESPVCYKVNESDFLAEVFLSVMNVLPRPMIMDISWCTGSAYMRKQREKPLLCQFLSGVSDVKELSDVSELPLWMKYILDGILRGDVNNGQLIRMFVDDIGDSAENYSAIVRVLYTLEDYFKTGINNEERYKQVFEIIASCFPDKDTGMVLKKLCVAKTFSSKYCNDTTFFLLFATLPIDDVFDLEETGMKERWRLFIEDNHERYVQLLSLICNSGNVNKWGEKALSGSFGVLTEDDVTSIIQTDDHLFSTITHLNPKFLDEVQWSVLTSQEIYMVLPLLLDSRTQEGFTHWSSLFEILLDKGVEINRQLAERIFTKTTEATGILLDFVNRDGSRYINYILGKQIEQRSGEVLSWLGSIDTITDNIANAIVNVVQERSDTVIRAGSKIWKPFLGLSSHSLRPEVYTFLFALSFNWPTDIEAIELMRMAFYPLHTLQASRQLGYGNWSRIAGYMESVMPWDEWDNCKKMRKTIVKRLKRAGFDKRVLDDYTPDVALNEQLKKLW